LVFFRYNLEMHRKLFFTSKSSCCYLLLRLLCSFQVFRQGSMKEDINRQLSGVFSSFILCEMMGWNIMIKGWEAQMEESKKKCKNLLGKFRMTTNYIKIKHVSLSPTPLCHCLIISSTGPCPCPCPWNTMPHLNKITKHPLISKLNLHLARLLVRIDQGRII